MALDGSGGMQMHPQRPAAVFIAEASASSSMFPHLDEESWHMSFSAAENIDSGPYPERPGELNCAYYLRTGVCRFGVTCRFNHPPNRELAVEQIKGAAYPERVGQPECQYYLKTGTCKFGPTCKFHHPKDKGGITGGVQYNSLGYPLRPNEKDCAFYLRTGQCKFSNTCKFHHPQPSDSRLSLHGSPAYPSMNFPTTPGQQSVTAGLANWPLSKSSFASPHWQGPSSYAQLILPQGLVQVPSWNTFSGKVGSALTPKNQQQNSWNAQFLGTSLQSEPTTRTLNSFSSVRLGSVLMGQYASQRGSVFPERPGEPECQFYVKTGDCKFGAVCKFHHPRERIIPTPNCILSPLGLPLRPGEPLCIFYSRYGICKFGPNCKFDHPIAATMGIFAYSLSASSPGVPVVRGLVGSSSGSPRLTLSLESSSVVGPGKSRCLPLTGLKKMNSDDESTVSEQ